MKLARVGEVGRERPAVVVDDGYLDLSSVTAEIDAAFFETGGVDRARAAVVAGALPELASPARIGAPVARPGAVVCIGLNYRAHAAESGAEVPRHPVMFLKPSNTVVGPYDVAVIPRGSAKTDWEVELGVVIGRRTSYLASAADAPAHIAGYVTANDLSERAFQLEVSGGQWSKGKASQGFTPVGPWLVTPDEVPLGSLRLRSWVNGEPRQDSTADDMIFDVATIVWHLSQFMVLDPGDLILTGTPEGVALSGRFPYLRAGDVVEVEVEGLGHQRQEFADA